MPEKIECSVGISIVFYSRGNKHHHKERKTSGYEVFSAKKKKKRKSLVGSKGGSKGEE